MIAPMFQERRSFIVFFCFLMITALSKVISTTPDVIEGASLILWGLFGVSRYMHLSSTAYLKLPKILTLPSRILFGFNQEKETQANITIDRFLKFDFLLFSLLGLLFIVWGVYCSFYPADISLLHSFWTDKEFILTKPETSIYGVIERISQYVMATLIFFIAVTYAQNKTELKIAKIIFLPILVFLAGYIAVFSPASLTVLENDFSSLRGIGWDGFSAVEALTPDTIQNSDTGFVRRYIETGILGAYGLYLVFFIVFISMVKNLVTQEDRIGVFIAILALMTLLAFDFLWLWSSFISAFQHLALGFIGCFWRSPLTREQI